MRGEGQFQWCCWMDTLEKHRTRQALYTEVSEVDQSWPIILHGYDEDDHVIFILIDHEFFMIELK